VLEDYKKHCKEREEMGIPPLPLDAEQTAAVINLLKKDHDENELLLFLLKVIMMKQKKNLKFYHLNIQIF